MAVRCVDAGDFEYAVLQLWNWVGEQKDRKEKESLQSSLPANRQHAAGYYCGCRDIRETMQTLFAGLIDFE